MKATNAAFNPSNNEHIAAIKEATLAYQAVLEAHAPSSRRLSIALTHLETCAMFAVKAVAEGE